MGWEVAGSATDMMAVAAPLVAMVGVAVQAVKAVATAEVGLVVSRVVAAAAGRVVAEAGLVGLSEGVGVAVETAPAVTVTAVVAH